MIVADLHVHTTNSDGTLTLDALPGAAAAAGLEAVAVTDHDRVHPDLDGPLVDLDGLAVVHGIELRVEPRRDGDPGERVDLLGYGVRRTDALDSTIDRIQSNRVERGRAIVERVEDRLGVDLGLTVEPGFGRPDVARAVARHPGTDLDYQGVFDELVGNGGPCYVRREVPTFADGLAVLRESCDVVGLAHPFRYDDVDAALALSADLDAVERYYPYDREIDPGPVERAIREHDLLATGGTDAHERTLGRAGLAAEEYRRFRAALDVPDA